MSSERAALKQQSGPPPSIFGRGPMGGFGMPVQKAKDFKGTLRRLTTYLEPHKPGLSIVIWGWLLFASLANAELLLGTPTPLTNVIIGLLTVAFIGGFAFASWAAVRKPHVYARIGRETV